MTTVKRIALIRPGETDWNLQGRWQGWVAVPLNDHGRQQARSLAKFIRNLEISALYVSDSRRAVETATILCEQLPLTPHIDARLRERNIGLWQGLTPDEMKAWYPDDYAQMLADINGYRIPAGESRDDVRARVLEALHDYLSEGAGEVIGILSHTTTFKVMLETLIPSYDPLYIALDNSSVTSLRLTDNSPITSEHPFGIWEIVIINDQTHLEGLSTRSVGELEANQ